MLRELRELAPPTAIVLVSLGGIAYATSHPTLGAWLVAGGLMVLVLLAALVVGGARRWHVNMRRLRRYQRKLANLRERWQTRDLPPEVLAHAQALISLRDEIVAGIPRRFAGRFDSTLRWLDEYDTWTYKNRDWAADELDRLLGGMIEEWADERPS